VGSRVVTVSHDLYIYGRQLLVAPAFNMNTHI
jgi:hypothetical protein